MAKSKSIIVKNKETQRVVERMDVNHLYNDFQIGYEAGKLSSKYDDKEHLIYLESTKIK